MARITTLFERAFVGITVAIRTICELETGIARLVVRPRRMAALAKNKAMLAGEGKLCLRMVKISSVYGCGFPVQCGMASRAIRAKAALVLIFVAIHATRRQAHPCTVQILAGKQCALLRGNVLRSMA